MSATIAEAFREADRALGEELGHATKFDSTAFDMWTMADFERLARHARGC
jgi:hypothetical protein